MTDIKAIEDRLAKANSPWMSIHRYPGGMDQAFADIRTLLDEVERYRSGVGRIAGLKPNSGSSLDACIDIAGELLRGAP